jgi:HK97 family phage prohead protease
VSGGQRVAFARGAFDVNQKAAKLIEGHDLGQLRGTVNALADMEEGLGFTATFARTRASADAVELVRAGAYDAVSVGADVIESHYDKELKATVVTKAKLIELSLVAVPAFTDAKIDELIAASAEETEPDNIPETTPTPTPSEEDAMSESTTVEAAVATQPIYATARREVKLPTAAEYIAAAAVGGDQFAQMREVVRAAAPNVTTSDSAGLLPQILVQPVYNNFVGSRPTIDAIGPRSIPASGSSFRLPYVSTHNTVASQSAENATLQASTFVVSAYDVSKVTYGGYVTVSEQDMDWSSPEVVGLLLDDMAKIYAYTTNDAVADAVLAATTQTAVLTPTSPSEWASDISDACVTILNASNGNKPTTLFLSPNMFGYLSKLVDTTGRPLFSTYSPMNTFGTAVANTFQGTAFGLTVVVDRAFATDTVIVADPSGYFVGEVQKGAISIDNPSTLSRTMAFRGYLAQKMVDATKFVKLT